MAGQPAPGRSEYRIGRFAGLDLSFVPSALWSMAAIWLGAGLITFWLLGRGWGWAVLGGLLVVIIHWLSVMPTSTATRSPPGAPASP